MGLLRSKVEGKPDDNPNQHPLMISGDNSRRRQKDSHQALEQLEHAPLNNAQQNSGDKS